MIDTVSITGPRRTDSWTRPKELVSLLERWQEIAGLYPKKVSKQPQDPLARPSPEEKTFWRTIFAGTWYLPLFQTRPIQDDEISKIISWWTWFQSKAETFIGNEWDSLRHIADPDDYQHITEMFWNSTETRKLFLLEKERWIGIGTCELMFEGRGTSVGDEVHVVLGCPVLLVLRKLGGPKHVRGCVEVKGGSKRPQTCNSNVATAKLEPSSSVASSPLQAKVLEDDTTLSSERYFNGS